MDEALGDGSHFMEAPDFGAEAWPRLAVFIFALPDHLPLPHLTTMTRVLDLDEPALADRLSVPVEGLVPIDENQGKLFVSMRVWQADAEPDLSLVTSTDEALRIASRMWPRVLPPKESDSEARARWFSDAPNYRTFVEAVTFAGSAEDFSSLDEVKNPLSRSIDAIAELVRGYRISKQQRIAPLAYERLPIFVPCFWRKLESSPTDVSGPTIMLLDHSNVGTLAGPETLNDRELSDMRVTHGRLLAGDPFILYKERRLDAQVAFWNLGQYGECCVQAAIGSEVLFDGLLGMLMWEECRAGKISIEDASRVFSSDLVSRLTSQYHGRLGGTWSFERGHISIWDSQLASVRNRVVHAGYKPSREEAGMALEALVEQERFIQRKLVAKFSTYPLTSVLYVGQPGFERAGKWKSVSSRIEQMSVDWLDVIHEYSEWREEMNRGIVRRRRSPRESKGRAR